MADSLAVSLTFLLTGTWTDTQDMGSILDSPRFNLDDTLSDGVGLDQADQIWHDERTLAGTSESLDLTALTRTVYGSTNTINFARIKGVLIKNVNTTSTHQLIVGAAASNAWTGWTSVAASTYYVEPNGIDFKWAPTAAGWVTSGTSKSLKIDAGANTIVYRIAIIGASA